MGTCINVEFSAVGRVGSVVAISEEADVKFKTGGIGIPSS